MIANLVGITFLGNRLLDYLVVLVLFFLSLVLIVLFERVLLKALRKWADKTVTSIDDFVVGLVQRIFLPFGYCAAFYLCLNYLTLAPFVKKILNIGVIAVITFFVARFASLLATYAYTVFWRRRGKTVALERSLSGILRLMHFIIWSVSVVFLLDNWGFKISAVIAGLGIGGVAVALAAQAVLGDLFSYFAILFDNPFEIGDFIIVGEYLGSVEHIGIKTTRIRSLSGEQVVFSNTDLTNSRIRNYKRMGKRRVLFSLGVTYGTGLAELKEIPKIIEEIITQTADTAFDRAHFFSYGDFSLNYEIVYYVLSSDYNVYMDIQQSINFKIREAFDARGIEFAYPTQTLYVNSKTAE